MVERWPLLVGVVLAGLVLGVQPQRPAGVATAGSGFQVDTIVTGLDSPTAFAFAPDGRIFVTEKRGVVRIVQDGAIKGTPFLTIENKVNDWWDRGLLGIALDPDFDDNGYVYLYYVYENNPNPDAYRDPKTARVTRVTANGDAAVGGSETVLIGTVAGNVGNSSCEDFAPGTDCIAADSQTHNGGALRFDGNGKLWVAIGDGAFYTYPDERALRSQHLDRLNGKILRVNRDGSGVSDNPFWTGDGGANRSKVWAFGLRNPFRFAIRPGSNIPYIGDVGSVTWEEQNVGLRGANLGWPCWEGDQAEGGFSFRPECDGVGAGTNFQLWKYDHGNRGSAAVGGVFYSGSSYPAENVGAYFAADYVQGFIKRLRVNDSHQLQGVDDLEDNAGAVVDMATGANGDIYFISFLGGQIKRLRFGGVGSGNRDPVAIASVDPSSGAPPLTVRFSGAASFDPDGDRLSYSWDFGDGERSTSRKPRHTYTGGGTYHAVLAVSDPQGGLGTTSVPVSVGDALPKVKILSPRRKLKYSVGQTVQVRATGHDPEEGELPPENFAWRVILQHCDQAGCHMHNDYANISGPSGSFQIEDHGDGKSFLEIYATAWDHLPDHYATSKVEIQPKLVKVAVSSQPAGAQVFFGVETLMAPFKRKVAAGARRTVGVQSPQSIRGSSYSFGQWSDNGGQFHDVDVGTGRTKRLKVTMVKGQ